MEKLHIQHHAEQSQFRAEVDGYALELDYLRRGDQLLGRVSTVEEQAYLAQPGSGF